MSELLIVNGRLLDPANRIDGVRHLAIDGGKVVEVSEKPFAAERLRQAEVLEAKDCWVMPGFIDLHVHLREPGQEYKETVASGSAAAVAGGFSTVCCMPNTKPVNDNASITEFILRKAREADLARVHPIGAISKGSKGEELAEIGELRQAGCVAISDDGRPVSSSALMRRALEYTRTFGMPVVAHEEDLCLVGKGVMHEGKVSTRLGLRGIPGAAEESMIARDLALVELTGGRLHVAHISCAGSVRLVREAKRRGLPVTCEAAPHHFTLTDEEVARSQYGTSTKVNPPLRADADREAVLEGLADGTIDAIATDHAPHSIVEKELEYDLAANGMIGLETALPLSLELVRQNRIEPLRLAELLSTGPACCFKLAGGSLSVGVPADVTVVAPGEAWTCEPARLHSKSKNTPFAGWQLKGRAKATVVGGRIRQRDGAISTHGGRES